MNNSWWARLGLMFALVPVFAAADAQSEAPAGGFKVMESVERLKPGEYLWVPNIAPEGPVLVMVSLTTQRAVVYRNGVPIGISTISSGKKGHETPTGVFTILQRKVDHKSNLYNDAPMPYMQRLTWSGIALHAGNLPGQPASHGCIRLPLEFARQLYGVTRLGVTVIVTADAALPRVAPSQDLFANAAASNVTMRTGIAWHPEVSPEGPVSIIVSAADGRAVVLRNGKEIGTAPIQIKASVLGTSAYSLQTISTAGPEWLRLSLTGVPGQPAEQSYRGKIIMDEGFKQAVLSILRPGATIVVTPDTLRSGATGNKVELELAEPHD